MPEMKTRASGEDREDRGQSSYLDGDAVEIGTLGPVPSSRTLLSSTSFEPMPLPARLTPVLGFSDES